MKTLMLSILCTLFSASAFADDTGARDAFAKTFAAGEKTWALKNVVVEFSKSVKRVPQEKWTAVCTASHPVSLKGAYPSVTLGMGAIDCGASHPSGELSRLSWLTSRMAYQAAFIPALPSEPNQFRLDLSGAVANGFLRWNSQKALNANLREGVVFLDFVGEERGDLGWPDITYHYVDLSFRQGAGQEPARLKVNYTLDAEAQQESTEIKISADLVPVPNP